MNMNYYKHLYKWDKISKILLIFGVLLSLTKGNKIIGIALVIYALWRAGDYSKFKRNMGDLDMNRIKSDVKNAVKSIKDKIKERKDFLITRCPNCSQKLRLPRKKGNILVTCPRCGYKFKLKT